jgi:adenylate cyclase
MPDSHQLAAIMFTDIVGYTALMGHDSAKALDVVRISKEIQRPLVDNYQGQWLKEMGDGVLIRFQSVMNAVHCAVEIQAACRARFDGKLRIGIHLGEITIKENDIFGDGVNVASRLESIADPGGSTYPTPWKKRLLV